MTIQAIPVFKPLIEQEEMDASIDALRNGWLGMGSYVEQFEQAVADLVAAPDRSVVATSTGHAALHLALTAAGVGPGDEVITPSFNNVADLQAILACGAEVVFTDILDDTLCLDPSGLEEVISPRTKAIIATDYARHVCIHDEISRVAQEQGLRVVHDAAHSIGSTYLGQPIGSFSDITIFSFDPVKTFTCIDGGAVVVDDPESLRTLREARLIGMGQPTEVMYQDRRAWTYDVHRVGYRYHMANLHAAIGLAQLRKRPLIQENRRRYCSIYDDAFSSCQLLRPQREPLDGILPFLYYVRVKNQLRDEFRNGLSRKGIDTGVHWQPGHRFSLFSSARRGRLDVTEVAAAEIVSLPLHSVMSDETINRVIDAVISTAEELV